MWRRCPERSPVGMPPHWGWLYGISASSQHPEEAWALIEFLSGEAMQKRFAQEVGIAPSRTALFSDPDLLAASPQLRNHLAILQAATPPPTLPDLSCVCRICCSGISAAPWLCTIWISVRKRDHRCSHQPAAGPDDGLSQ